MAATYISMVKTSNNDYHTMAQPLYTCDSVAAASDKFITADNLTASDLVAGLVIRINFTDSNEDSTPYLTIKNSDNVIISDSVAIYGNYPKTPQSFCETDNTIMSLCYDGTAWRII